MDFEIDFGNVLATAPPDTSPLLASVDGVAHTLGSEECVFEDRASGEIHVMTVPVVQALELCRPFRSLDQHVAAVGATLPGMASQLPAVRRVLEHMVERGLLRDATTWLSTLGREVAPAQGELGAVFVRACDRPAQFEALLESLSEQERASGRLRRLVVIDDSREAAASARHAAALARRRVDGAPAVHVDATRWNSFANQLARAVPEAAAAVRYALAAPADAAQPGGGRGFNLAVLLGHGARYALLDDDFRLPLHRVPGAIDGIDLAGTADFPARFHDDLAGALDEGEPDRDDPFERQLAWCGQPLHQVLADPALAPDRAQLLGLTPSALPGLAPGTHVIATCNGHRGHSGAAGVDWMYLLDPASLRSFAADRARYLRALEGGPLGFGAPRARLLDQGHFLPFLLDGTRLLPPTLPAGRSEDLLFGMLCKALYPRSVVLHGNRTIGHVQEGARDRSRLLDRADTPGLAVFINDFLGSRLGEIRAQAPAQRLSTLAGWLRDLAAASAHDRIGLLDDFLRFRRADLVHRLQAVFGGASDAPLHFQSDLRRLIEANGRAVARREAPRLAGWPEGLDAAACAQRLAAELQGFADTLEHWLLLAEAARPLAARLLATA